ncbi:cyclin-D1-binding protein 1 homolog isoform X2 [Syngnathoides biaculeatus]|uniref:cyclin-D1-binding protein 1 homolog isoform X2 n=1 Tax=Syngnathoides biaculeatus TaxID=300417 RepID=UPI002ADE5094|nr:cyclin-D1-binding protein 1 homolog isoform X2 [Syngnathoides biaculeatus]
MLQFCCGCLQIKMNCQYLYWKNPMQVICRNLSRVKGRGRNLKYGECNESDGDFNLSNFWDTLNQAVKAVSQEATKVSLAFSKPPLPSQQVLRLDGERLADSVLKSVLSLSTVYYWLPKSRGVSLRQQVRDATVQVLEGLTQLLEVILSSPLQSLTQEQLMSTGGVWSACDRFIRLPEDNKAAALLVLTAQGGIVKDAIDELEQALSEAHDPFGDVLDDEEPRGNRDTYWSERDRRVVAACRGMMTAAAACLRKTTAAVRARGDADAPERAAQLDDLVDGVKEISPRVDDLALCLYPPVDYDAVENDVSKLAALLKKVLSITRSSHFCGEAELTWVQFLEGAVDHNLQKAKNLIGPDS